MDGERWLSYAELAEMRGITHKAAVRLTQRHGWRRQTGNDRTVRVLVPAGAEQRQTPRQAPTSDPATVAAIAALREANAGLVVRAERAEAEADRLRQAEAERHGRGRWRRAWDGWRGPHRRSE